MATIKAKLIINLHLLKERYAIRKSSCTEGFLFDGIEKLCMVAEQANCNGNVVHFGVPFKVCNL